MCVCACVYVCMCTRVCACMHACVQVHARMHVYTCDVISPAVLNMPSKHKVAMDNVCTV